MQCSGIGRGSASAGPIWWVRPLSAPTTLPRVWSPMRRLPGWMGAEVVVPTTAGGDVVLGISVARAELTKTTAWKSLRRVCRRPAARSLPTIRCGRFARTASKQRATLGVGFFFPTHPGALLPPLNPQDHRALPRGVAPPSPRSGLACVSGGDQRAVFATLAALGRVGTDLPGGQCRVVKRLPVCHTWRSADDRRPSVCDVGLGGPDVGELARLGIIKQ